MARQVIFLPSNEGLVYNDDDDAAVDDGNGKSIPRVPFTINRNLLRVFCINLKSIFTIDWRVGSVPLPLPVTEPFNLSIPCQL